MTEAAIEDVLALQQWLSPAFPIGGFAYSHGLETAIAEGRVTDASTSGSWVRGVLERGAGFADAVLLIAVRRGGDVAALSELAQALSVSSERWRETMDLGGAFAAMASRMGVDSVAAPLPVSVGMATRSLALDDQTIAASYLQSFAATLINAAVRYVPLGQGDGQAMLRALAPLCRSLAQRAARTAPEDITGFAPSGDLDSMAHETLAVRIFRT